MKEKDGVELITERLDSIEKILKMLVVNSLVDELKDTIDTEFLEEKSALSMELNELLAEFGMNAVNIEHKNGFTLVYIEPGNSVKYKVKDFMTLDWRIKDSFLGMIPVFKFASLNGMQRMRLIDEEISFCVNEKEIHICARYV